MDGAVLGAAALVLRWFGKAGDDRVLILNLGVDLHLESGARTAVGPTGRLLLAVAVVKRRSGLRRCGDSSLGNRRELDDPGILGLGDGSPEGDSRMRELIRKMPWGPAQVSRLEPLLTREWLITNGLGGYASGTVAGVLRAVTMDFSSLPCPRRSDA